MIIASLQSSDYISLVAIVIALLSFAASFYFGYRDRVKVKAFSEIYQSDDGSAYMEIRIVNHGRRVAVITMFGGNLENGGWQATHIGEKGLGIRLAEREFHKKFLSKGEVVSVSPEGESEYVNLWFEDSLGKRHPVKNAEKHLRLLKESK